MAGSGKTTLLNSLAGRMQAEGWTRYLTPRPTDIVADGDVLFNGVPKTPKEIRRIAAYVMQKVRSTWAHETSRAACVFACTLSHVSFMCVLRNPWCPPVGLHSAAPHRSRNPHLRRSPLPSHQHAEAEEARARAPPPRPLIYLFLYVPNTNSFSFFIHYLFIYL
jgi:hypothetical protein